jgi:hypothetical protein
MSIPSKQIGWSNESNLLWQISKQLEQLTGVTSKINSVTPVTKAQMDILISTNKLIPGAFYLISGVDVPLYGGTTILIQAATTNKLNLQGHGVFYNPKYINTQATPNNGYGIWSSSFTITMSNVVGTFTSGDNITANNGATATYISGGFLQWVSGNWSLATSISNGFGATADVADGVSPSYAIGSTAIWGGKHWTNKTGAVGSYNDKYTLDSTNWEAIAFNSVDYNIVADVIHYDQEHDLIIRRVDKWNNDVSGNYLVFNYIPTNFANAGNPIKDFQWGNGPEDYNLIDGNRTGVFSNYVRDSYLDCINFRGNNCSSNKLTQLSSIDSNTTDTTSSIISNDIIGGVISGNILSNLSYIGYNTIGYSGISGNILSDSSTIGFNKTATYFHIDSIILTNASNIEFNVIDGTIGYGTLSTSDIKNNVLQNSYWVFSGSGTLTSKTIANINSVDGTLNVNIASASIIYGNYSKQMFKNSAGVTKLSYYNASNVLTVVAPNA